MWFSLHRLDLVEGVGEAVGRAVQRELAGRREAMRIGCGRVVVGLLLLGLILWLRCRLMVLLLWHGIVGGLHWRRSGTVLWLWGGLLVRLLLLAERGIVVARIVGSIIAIVVAAERGLRRRGLIGLWLILLLWLIASGGHGLWWCWGSDGQVITRCLEAVKGGNISNSHSVPVMPYDLPILASCVGDGATLARGIHIAVATVACAIRIGLLLEVDAILLCVGGTELAIAGQIALLTDNGRCLGVLVIVLTHCQGHECGHCELSRNKVGSISQQTHTHTQHLQNETFLRGILEKRLRKLHSIWANLLI